MRKVKYATEKQCLCSRTATSSFIQWATAHTHWDYYVISIHLVYIWRSPMDDDLEKMRGLHVGQSSQATKASIRAQPQP